MIQNRKKRIPVTPAVIEAIILSINSSRSSAAVFEADSSLPTTAGISLHFKRNPNSELEARWKDAIRSARLRRRGFDDEIVDQLTAKIEAGMTFKEASRATAGAPRSLTAFLGRRPHLKARFEAALERSRSVRLGYDKNEVIELIANRSIKGGYRALLNRKLKKKYWPSIVRNMRRDERFAPRLGLAQSVRRAMQRTVRSPKPNGRHPSENALALVKQHPLYCRAMHLLPMADGNDADDMRMDAIVAMLESREVERAGIIRNHHKKFSALNTLSLEDRIDEMPVGEMLTTDVWIAV